MARRPKTDTEGQDPAAVPPGVAAGGAAPAPAAAGPAMAPGAGGVTASPADALPAIEVTGPARGRRRAGRRFGPEPVVLARDEIGPEAEAAIRADPLLAVRETFVPAG